MLSVLGLGTGEITISCLVDTEIRWLLERSLEPLFFEDSEVASSMNPETAKALKPGSLESIPRPRRAAKLGAAG